MSAYDPLEEQLYAVPCPGVRFLDESLNVVGGLDRPSSFIVFSYRSTANFHSLTSSYRKTLPFKTPTIMAKLSKITQKLGNMSSVAMAPSYPTHEDLTTTTYQVVRGLFVPI